MLPPVTTATRPSMPNSLGQNVAHMGFLVATGGVTLSRFCTGTPPVAMP